MLLLRLLYSPPLPSPRIGNMAPRWVSADVFHLLFVSLVCCLNTGSSFQQKFVFVSSLLPLLLRLLHFPSPTPPLLPRFSIDARGDVSNIWQHCTSQTHLKLSHSQGVSTGRFSEFSSIEFPENIQDEEEEAEEEEEEEEEEDDDDGEREMVDIDKCSTRTREVKLF